MVNIRVSLSTDSSWRNWGSERQHDFVQLSITHLSLTPKPILCGCVHVYVCMHAHTCVLYTCTSIYLHVEARGHCQMSSLSLPIFFSWGQNISLSVGTGWEPARRRESLAYVPLSMPTMGLQAPWFLWVLGIRTLILVFEQQALLPTEPSPQRPQTYFNLLVAKNTQSDCTDYAPSVPLRQFSHLFLCRSSHMDHVEHCYCAE